MLPSNGGGDNKKETQNTNRALAWATALTKRNERHTQTMPKPMVGTALRIVFEDQRLACRIRSANATAQDHAATRTPNSHPTRVRHLSGRRSNTRKPQRHATVNRTRAPQRHGTRHRSTIQPSKLQPNTHIQTMKLNNLPAVRAPKTPHTRQTIQRRRLLTTPTTPHLGVGAVAGDWRSESGMGRKCPNHDRNSHCVGSKYFIFVKRLKNYTIVKTGFLISGQTTISNQRLVN